MSKLLPIEQIDHIAIEVVNSRHGDFLKTLFQAWIRADSDNKSIMSFFISHIIFKYKLDEEFPMPEFKKYTFTHAQIIPVDTGIYIHWGCEGVGFGRLEITKGRVDREAMDNEFIIALFEYLEGQENAEK